MRIAVVTPTTGNPYLAKAILSVRYQTVPVDHYVFVDGKEYWKKAYEITREHPHLKVYQLPENTGKGGFNGHRIYAASSYLVNADYVFFLDEDNYYDPPHVDTCIRFIEEHGLDWCYSLRKIVGENDDYLCHDDCDSLGYFGNYCDGRPGFVDTSCYAFTLPVLTALGHVWYTNDYTADFRFYQFISAVFPNYGCTGRYTSEYRLHGKTSERFAGWFRPGNRKARETHPNGFPWNKPTINEPASVQSQAVLPILSATKD